MAVIITGLLFLWVSLVTAGFMPFEDCGSTYYLENIEISGCSVYPCHLQVGSTVNVTTYLRVRGEAFSLNDLSQNVYFVVSSLILDAKVTPDPCTGVRGSQNMCDLHNGERLIYQAALTVDPLPALPAKLWWKIRDRANQLVVCYRMTVVLTN